MNRFGHVLLLLLGLASYRAAGQTTTPVSPRPAARLPTAVFSSGAQPNQAALDEFARLVASSASFDMDSPVETKAEFDPSVTHPGTEVVYRITVTALDESLKIPDQFPLPGGLTLTPGGRGQIYQPSGAMRVRPQTTINFHAVAATNGDFTIASFNAMAYGKEIAVPAATLKVVGPGEVLPPESPRLFLQLPSGDVFVGQTLTIPLAMPMLGNGNLAGMSQPRVTGEFVFSEPSFSAVMRQENVQREGRNFPSFVQEVTATPLKPGALEIVGQAYGIFMRPIPGQPNIMQNVTELVDSGPMVLFVKPLPNDGKMPGFTGAIGSFRIDPPRLSTNSVRAGEPLILLVTVHGTGNVGRLTPPPTPAARDWQGFPPISDNLSPAFVQQRGYATFSYTWIPVSDKTKATPPIPFSYFDPQRKAYVDLTIPPVPVEVKPVPGGIAATPKTSGPKSGNPNDDESSSHERELVLGGLAETPRAATASLLPVQQRGSFLLLQLALAAALSGLFAWDRWRRFLEQHPDYILKRRGRRGAGRQLRIARRAAAANDALTFVSSAIEALREACAPHDAATPSALVCADILRELPSADRDGRAGEMIRRLFGAADAIRFGGPIKEGPELLALRPELESVLNQLTSRL